MVGLLSADVVCEINGVLGWEPGVELVLSGVPMWPVVELLVGDMLIAEVEKLCLVGWYLLIEVD